MEIYLDWALFNFSMGEEVILVVGRDEHGYYLTCYPYEDEGYVTTWYESDDFNENVLENVYPPEDANLHYRQLIKNLLDGAIL